MTQPAVRHLLWEQTEFLPQRVSLLGCIGCTNWTVSLNLPDCDFFRGGAVEAVPGPSQGPRHSFPGGYVTDTARSPSRMRSSRLPLVVRCLFSLVAFPESGRLHPPGKHPGDRVAKHPLLGGLLVISG